MRVHRGKPLIDIDKILLRSGVHSQHESVFCFQISFSSFENIEDLELTLIVGKICFYNGKEYKRSIKIVEIKSI